MVRGEREVCGNSSSGEEASKSKSWLAACKHAAVCRLIWQAGGSVCSAVQKGGAGGARRPAVWGPAVQRRRWFGHTLAVLSLAHDSPSKWPARRCASPSHGWPQMGWGGRWTSCLQGRSGWQAGSQRDGAGVMFGYGMAAAFKTS